MMTNQLLCTLVQWLCQICVMAYTVYSFVIAFSYLIIDIKSPFLGMASSYLVTYLMVCAVPLVTIQFWRLYTASYSNIAMILYICMLIAAFECSIFITKRFYWTNPKREALLNAVMHITMGMFILIASRIFHDERFLLTGSITSWQELLWTIISLRQMSTGSRELLFLMRILPCVPLFVLWVYSISKRYNALEKSFFEKSVNKPILYFLIYTLGFAATLVLDVSPVFQIVYVALILYFKVTFLKTILFYLKTRSMEKVEVQYTMEVSK